jgi:L,D-transpeptidase-like protein
MHLMKTPAAFLAAVLTSFLFIFATVKTSPHDEITVVAAGNTDKAKSQENNSALFSDLHLGEAGMNQMVFNSAVMGLEKLNSEGDIKRNDIVTIIDFSQPSNKKRLYVLDLENKRILFNTLVAHGRNSGTLWAKSFSNNASSLKSSPGFYVTGETYIGDNGYSLRLDGMEKNINDNARNRSIVVHGAAYVDQSAVNFLGFLGRSLGCPAVPVAEHKAIINTIKDGTCLFIYSPDRNYLKRSTLLNS